MKLLSLKNRNAWRSWLEKNGRTCDEVWLVYYKKGSGRTGISYDASVEEGLCFGWIDSIIKRLDEKRCARKFTPRKPESRWAASNIARVQRLIKEGKMAAPGLEAFRSHATRAIAPRPTQLPKELPARFRKEKLA